MFKEAVWINGKKEISGAWNYNWASDSFTISLNSKDRITGEDRTFIVKGDSPEWGNWKLKK